MDTKNDDSGGSDSLDKSLQKKCVVDEGEEASKDIASSNVCKEPEVQVDDCNSTRKQKTEKNVGGSGNCGGSTKCSTINITPKNDEKLPAAHQISTTISNTTDLDLTPTTSSKSNAETANSNSSNNNAFETKVKQISKNLKETTLAETGNQEQIGTDESTSASTSSTASNATSPDSSEIGNAAVNADEQANEFDGTPMNTSMISDSNDDADSRSKKVRFHPDVKENDGGNRVIPKKKKKLKSSTGSDDATSSQTGADDEMELDDDEDYEEDDEFDLAKTIAEAQDYLKEHPLTFVRPCDKSAGRLQNGLLEEEDLKLLETGEEEEFIDAVIPENGIERILGKQTKGGRVEFLLRFTNQPGLFWESEDFIATQCPSLLTQYEFNRERRQDRLMRHVAKRQNLRQRYTDF